MASVWGRETELAAAACALEDAGSDPFALVLSGTEGIGKTTVWKQVVSVAEDRGFRVLAARPVESEATFAFAAVADLLRGVVDEAIADLPAPQRDALDAALLRSEAESSPDPRAVAFAFYTAMVALARSRPSVLAIDDVQWLDGPSARVLEFALRRLAGVPVGVVVASRAAGEDAGPSPLGLDASALADRVVRLPIGPLSFDAVRQIVASRVRIRLARWIVTDIHEAAGGNPLLALELARALERRGVDIEPGQPLPIPRRLGDLLHDRLESLPEAVRTMLLLVAASAKPTTSTIAAALGDQAAFDGALREAVVADVVEVSFGRLAFTNPMIGAALLAGSAPEARRHAHRLLAGVAADAEERARHLAQATDGTDENVAQLLEDMAEHARSRGAPEAAAQLAELSLLLTPDDAVDACTRRTSSAGRYAFESAHIERAEELLQKAAAGARGRIRAESLLYLSRVRYHRRDTASAAELAEKALDEAHDDASLQASIHLELAAAAELAGDHGMATERARRAVALAEQAPEGPIAAEAVSLLAYYTFVAGAGIGAAALERAKDLERRSALVRPLRSPTFHEALIRMRTDDLDGAREALLAIESRARDAGDESSLSVLLSIRGEIDTWSGRLNSAEALTDEARRVSEWTGQRAYLVLAAYTQSLVAATAGHADRADALARESLDLAERTGARQPGEFARAVLGFLELSKGEASAAHGWLKPLADGLAVRPQADPGVLRFLPDEVEALISLGELDRVRELLEPFDASAKALERSWAIGAAARCRGLLLASERRLDDAIESFEAAIRVQEKIGQPLEVGRTHLAHGMTLRRAKKWAPARASLGRALDVFDHMGAGLWAARATGELGRIGGRATYLWELTETEDRVARLVATGLSNKDVAARLFVSVSTVESNLRRAYRKLGVRSRAELSYRLTAPDAD